MSSVSASLFDPDGPAPRRMRVIAFIVSILLLGTLLAVTAFSAHSAARDRAQAEAARALERTHLVIPYQLDIAARDLVRFQRGYLLTRDPAFRTLLDDARTRFQENQDHLALAMKQEGVGQATIAQANAAASMLLATAGTIPPDADVMNKAALARSVEQGRESMETYLGLLGKQSARGVRAMETLRLRASLASERNEWLQYVLAATGFLFMLLAGIAVLQTSRALRLEQTVSRELALLAATDQMTGLLNRAAFLRHFQEVMACGDAPVVAIIDIDHFKAVNDSHGHAAGDAVICAVSARIRERMAGHGLAGRLGGEEFAVLLPGKTLAEARMLCDNLRSAVARDVIAMPEGPALGVTVSIGIAAAANGTERVHDLLVRADQALYRAKHAGRDRVMLAA